MTWIIGENMKLSEQFFNHKDLPGDAGLIDLGSIRLK